MRALYTISLLLTAVLDLGYALSVAGGRLLVVIEDVAEKSRYHKFWDDLGCLGPALTPKLLLQFIDQQGNILLTLSGNSPTPSAVASLLLELGIRIPADRASLVLDHFNYDISSASEKHDVLILPRPSSVRPDVRSFFEGDGLVAFPRGVAQDLSVDSPLLAPILRAPRTAYNYNPEQQADSAEDLFAVGEQIALVATMQARNSARFTVFGSVEALEDTWFDANIKAPSGISSRTANQDFAKQISAWTFQETGVLIVGRVEHHLSSVDHSIIGNKSVVQLGNINPNIYRIKNDVTFDIEISEHHIDHFTPLAIRPEDGLQLEFTMLSPFRRLDLAPISQSLNSSIFSTTFKLPDQHGIFRFQVNYKRPFLTNIDVKREVTVRHFAHDEWPRSWEISGGWVWIAGLWLTIVAWIAFVSIWLWSEPAYEERKGKKLQ